MASYIEEDEMVNYGVYLGYMVALSGRGQVGHSIWVSYPEHGTQCIEVSIMASPSLSFSLNTFVRLYSDLIY